MTAKETERLAKVEQKVDDLIESTDKNFEALNYKFDQFIRHANTSFITVAQAKVAAWFIGFTVSVVGIAVLIWSHMTK